MNRLLDQVDQMDKKTEANPGSTHCIACDSPHSRPLVRKCGVGEEDIILNRCPDCKTVFLSSWKAGFDQGLYNYYAERVDSEKSALYSPETELSYERLLASFKPYVSSSKVLDVGCGQGHFVDVAIKAGWDASGIELSEPAVAVCRKFDLPVRKLDLFAPDLEPGNYDLLTMFEVIEHVPCPGRLIARAEQLLKPGGLLYLTTPNYASLDRKVLRQKWPVIHREHLVYFSPYTLKSLVNRNSGFNVIDMATKNISPELILYLFHRSTFAGKAQASAELSAAMRKKANASPVYQALKVAVNTMLGAMNCGVTIAALLQRPYSA